MVLLYSAATFAPGSAATVNSLEAHDFAEATDEFKKQGATVIGVTAGNTDQIAKRIGCNGEFIAAFQL
jgi:peroxiredoxin Q/BCP